MKISIIGTGEVGTYYADHWSKAGHKLVLTYYRDQIKIETLALRLGKKVSVALPQKAVAQADVVLFCPRFEHMEDAAKQIGDIGNVILIDPNNPFNPDRSGPAIIKPNQTAASIVANLFPHARHVKAFHNLGIQTIIEIVFSQVTKADVRTGICRRNNVADFDLVVGDNHTIDQQFDQLTPLGKAGLLQPNLEPLTDRLDVGDGRSNLQQLLTVVGQLP